MVCDDDVTSGVGINYMVVVVNIYGRTGYTYVKFI